MGSSQSVGHLHLHLETRNVQAGAELPGVIHLKLNAPVQARALCLKFTGKEHCQWTETRTERDAQGNNRTVTDTHKGHCHVLHQKFPIFIFTQGYLDAGEYSFPFLFRVPANIPGSFHLEHGQVKASIKYSLIAMVEGSSMKIEKSKMDVHISQLMTDPIYSVVNDVHAHITTWCCCDQGDVQIKAYFSKNAYVPGEIAEFVAEVNNTNSKLDVGGIRGTLYRTLRLKSDGGRTHTSKDTVSRNEVRQRVPTGQALLGEQSLRMTLPISDSRGELQHSTSVRGKHIECMYSIVVHASMEGSCMCCGQTPEVERFMVLYPPQLPIIQPVMVPPGWAPQQMPMMQFEVGQNYEYAPSAPPA